MKAKLTIKKYADVSTCHITEQDSILLIREAVQGKGHMLAAFYCEGFFLRLLTPDCYDEQYHNIVIQAGYSEALWKLVKFCAEQNFNGINLDGDGEVYNELPIFDW